MFKDILWQLYFAFCANISADPITRQELLGYIRVIYLLEQYGKPETAPEDMHEVKKLMEITPVLPAFYAKSVPWAPSASPRNHFKENQQVFETGSVRPVGVGVLNTIKQTLVKYEMGEVAHIENVLQSESKEKVLRVLDKTEESYEMETETETLESKDSQTTDRFEIQREISKQTSAKTDLNVGVNVSASYGPAISVNTDTNFGYSQSKQESNRVATKYAKETVNSAVSSISERIREAKNKKTLHEVEETNTHGFDNANGTGHISGIYRWVDKIYKMEVVDSGEVRMMYEFIVPEPAAQYIYMEKNKLKSNNGLKMDRPEKPVISTQNGNRDFTPDDINEGNYVAWARKYNVTNIEPPKPEFETKSIYLGFPSKSEGASSEGENPRIIQGTEKNCVVLEADPVDVPEGYYPYSVRIVADAQTSNAGSTPQNQCVFYPYVGNIIREFKAHACSEHILFNLSDEEQNVDKVPVMLFTAWLAWFHSDITITFKRSDRTYKKWQLDTYMTIMEGYNALKARYDELEYMSDMSGGVVIQGRNPGINRVLETQELKRNCISLLRKEQLNFNYVNQPANDYPEINKNALNDSGGEVLYLEQVFEWENMLYVYYPYYYGRRKNWLETFAYEDVDPQFEQFLKAGAARIVVPVRNNIEPSLIHYINTGEVWNGGPPPVIDDDLYLSILAEIKETTEDNREGEVVLPSWNVKIPTTLVKLQETPELPSYEAE